MATREGYNIAKELEKRGWKLISPLEDTYGDPILIDPISGKEFDPFSAEIEQYIRDCEEKAENLPELKLE